MTLTGLDVEDRLVVELELAARERLAQVELEQPPRLRARVHPGSKKR